MADETPASFAQPWPARDDVRIRSVEAIVTAQVSTPGGGGYGAAHLATLYPNAPYRNGWSARDYLRTTPELFEAARSSLPENVELLHDVHSRLSPKEAVLLARALEPYRLYFLEDVLPPEHWDRLPEVRAASPVPIAVGELTTTMGDAVRLVRDGGVDFIRSHICAIGGRTPARKLADLAELSGVRTAWHGPGDTSPIGCRRQRCPGRQFRCLRHPGEPRLQRGDARRLPRHAADRGRLADPERCARLGDRTRPGSRPPVPRAALRPRRVGGRGPAARRCAGSAVSGVPS